MNKTKLLFFIITTLAMLLQFNTVLAEDTPNVLYCPEKIECTKDKSVSSCKTFGENLEYFSGIYADGTVKKGTYALYNIYSYYQYPLSLYSNNSCAYFGDGNGGPMLYIGMSNKNLILWEAALSNNTKWRGVGGYQVQCDSYPANSHDCPLERIPLVKITTLDNYLGFSKISAYANGILINNNDEYWSHVDNQFFWKPISMYQAWDACSDTGLCTIELMATLNQALIEVGSITVDMNNKMKIVNVHAITGFEISHDEKLNSIEIKPVSST